MSLVSEALESVKREREVNILVNPKHYPEVKKHMAVFAERLGANRLIQVFESADVPPGGCRIESELGKINADLIESSTPSAKLGGVESALPMRMGSPGANTMVSVQVPPTSVATT